jgi:hypothetical protein
MKIIVNKFFILIAFLIGFVNAFAGPHPPPPNNGKKPPPPPGLPINDDLYIVLIIALIFGIYVIYKYQLRTKVTL